MPETQMCDVHVFDDIARRLSYSADVKAKKQKRVLAANALELTYIRAQNACKPEPLRRGLRLAWNDYGARLISESVLLARFAEYEALAASLVLASPT